MKATAFAMMIGLSLALVGSGARSETMNTAGNVCHAYYGTDQVHVSYPGWKIGTFDVSPLSVSCPVPRQVGGRAMTVYIDFNHTSSTTTGCTVQVVNNDGTVLSSKAVIVSGVGALRGSASFTAAENPGWAYTYAQCSLNWPGQINGLTAAY
jgi:hypothetical protein